MKVVPCGLWEATCLGWVVWRFVRATAGEQSVTCSGTRKIQTWLADKLDTLDRVSEPILTAHVPDPIVEMCHICIPF